MKIETVFNIGQTVWCASRQRLEGVYDLKIEDIDIAIKEDSIEITYTGINSNAYSRKHRMWAFDYECFATEIEAKEKLAEFQGRQTGL